ncbi:hypothetical protein WJ69_23145 [Burkholderia ubonensis]|uniref:hypothetical protein n=1 Tax=Burkholderia ubonensis TaxID=101571 RepID=UPI000758EC8C|nr:hypothetical protein [Burkholderia ubonensis]KVO05599.1 hypothetical protein WJ69_23145 [Burkholderia ubonensis]
MIIRKLIRTDGTEQNFDRPIPIREAARRIGADTLHTITLADRKHVMLIDDIGIEKDLPINPEATRLYHEVCVPGTTHQIRGDVVIVPDADHAG